MGLHALNGLGGVIGITGNDGWAAHNVAHGARMRVESLAEYFDDDVAIGDDPDRGLVLGIVDDDEITDVLLPHEPAGVEYA